MIANGCKIRRDILSKGVCAINCLCCRKSTDQIFKMSLKSGEFIHTLLIYIKRLSNIIIQVHVKRKNNFIVFMNVPIKLIIVTFMLETS